MYFLYAGHFIQHCPTNGDPTYDIKKVKPPTGIPKSMLMATPDGSYALPSGAVAVLKPNEAAFEKEIEGLPSTRPVGDLPPELHCPLCREIMKDAVLTSKCCFKSFCDKCIRDHIISKSKCVCGATDILADDLLPNRTLRDTINRILESGNSSADNAGSTFQVQDMESARLPQPKIPSPTQSAASKGEPKPFPPNEESPNANTKETADVEKPVVTAQQVPEKVRSAKVADMSKATHESVSMREPASQGNAPLAEEEVQQKLAAVDAGKKKKKKKARLPPNDIWRAPQDLAAESYMMPMGPSAYNPYWTGMQPGIDGFMAPFAGPTPFTGFGLGPLDMSFGGIMPPDPFVAQGFMMPVVPPQRDLAEFGMGMNAGPPAMSREEFEAWKANMRRRREHERKAEREFSRDRDFAREMSSSGDVSSVKSKPAIPPPSSGDHHHHHRHRSERSSPERPARDVEPPPRPPSKRKSEHHDHDRNYDFHEDDQDRERNKRDHHRHHHHHHHHSRSDSSTKPTPEMTVKPTSMAAAAAAAADRKHKASVFSRISFPVEEEPTTKKRKVSSSTEAAVGGGSTSSSVNHHKPSSSANGYYEVVHQPSTVKAAVSSGTVGGGKKSSGSAALDYESSDDDRHFKRKPSRYEPSPPLREEWEEDVKHSKVSRDRERKHR
uniref:DWNN domain-containing protein n=1 Tax=Rhizophora mucronata TaxID=61149 RepID=A0A2P2MI11_RHIMU